MKKLTILFAALFLVGCGQATDEVTPLEPETVEQEEVQETEEKEEEAETEEEAEEEVSQAGVSSEEAATAGEQFDAQAEDVPEENTAAQSEPVQVSSVSEEEEAVVESEEDLDYDGDLGDADLYPNQPMFIDGVLHSGDTSGVSADMVVTSDELRAGGYTIYVLSQEDYNQLIQDINDGVIPPEEALSHYLSNY